MKPSFEAKEKFHTSRTKHERLRNSGIHLLPTPCIQKGNTLLRPSLISCSTPSGTKTWFCKCLCSCSYALCNHTSAKILPTLQCPSQTTPLHCLLISPPGIILPIAQLALFLPHYNYNFMIKFCPYFLY
jgi:hypothetical protein